MTAALRDIQSCVTEDRKRIENVGLYSSVRNEKFEQRLPDFRAKNICP